MKLNWLGESLRDLRVEHDELIHNMALRLDVRPSEVCKIQLGEIALTDEIKGNLINNYHLTDEQVYNLENELYFADKEAVESKRKKIDKSIMNLVDSLYKEEK